MGAHVVEEAEVAALAASRSLLDAAEALAVSAGAASAASWGWEARTKVLAMLDRTVELVGVHRSRVLAAHKADGQWARSGDRSFEAWRGRTSRKGPGAARAESELAEGLAALPQAARAVEDGEVSLAHAEVLTRLRARSSDAVRTALDTGGAKDLLATAARQRLDAPTFARRAAAWAAAQDTDAAERSFEAVRSRRFARVADRDGGTRLEAFLDPVAGASLRTALEALTSAPSPQDERTSEQRAADALTALAGRVLDAGQDRIGAQMRPHLSLLVPADTWTEIRRRRQARTPGAGAEAEAGTGTAAGAGAGAGRATAAGKTLEDSSSVAADLRPTPLAELDDGTVVPTSVLERLACDCEMTRIVLDAQGIPLDVGQTQRTYTKALRRAVLVRDAHCQWPGCTLRASWCDVHHIRWYSRGGPTSLANGLALCVFHHHEVHRRHIAITPVPGGTTFSRPDGSVIGTTIRHVGAGRLIPAMRVADDTSGCDDAGDGRESRESVGAGVARDVASRRGPRALPDAAPSSKAGLAGSTPPRSTAIDEDTPPGGGHSAATQRQRGQPRRRRAPDDLFSGDPVQGSARERGSE